MPVKAQIKFDPSHPAEIIENLNEAVRIDAEFLDVAGRGAANHLRRHFRGLVNRRNKLGASSTGFWGAAAQAVSHRVDGNVVTVSTNHRGVGLHYRGGVVKPVRRKYLSVPAHPNAHGKSPLEFRDLRLATFLSGRSGRPVLALIRPVEKDFDVYYWLVKSTKHRPDPSVLPQPDAMRSAAIRAGRVHLQERLRRTATA